ncbi:MAG: HrpJ domain-containing protein, partial [Waddliaceae bacterium]
FRSKVPRKTKTLKARTKTVTKTGKGEGKKERILPIKMIKDTAHQFQRRNPEMKAAVLVLLREQIKPGDTKEEILAKLKDFYDDVFLQDEALEFLLETTKGELHEKIKQIKDEVNSENEREIIAGRNISQQARTASDKGLGTPTTLRDMYRDITGNPRDSNTLFDELSSQYEFSQLEKVMKFLLHSLGSDMKAKGPSIPRGQLHRLITETRSLQAILGVYKFFKGRMGLVTKMFEKGGLTVPKQLNFENMAKQFMSLVRERYPSSDKVMQGAKRLGIEDGVLPKIVAFSQFRDSVRELSMSQIFKNLQHRDQVFMALIEALEELEDEYEEIDMEEDEDLDIEEDEDLEIKDSGGDDVINSSESKEEM